MLSGFNPPSPEDCPPEPGESCETPLFVSICASDVAQIDREYVCDTVTGTHWVVLFSDGVEVSRTDTGVPCTEPAPADTEIVRECRNGFVTIVFYTVPTDGSPPVETLASVTDEVCAQATDFKVITECLCDVATDGTITSFVRATARTVTVDAAGVINVDTAPIGDFTSELLDTSYTPSGTVSGCCEVGSPPDIPENAVYERASVCASINGGGPTPLFQIAAYVPGIQGRVATFYEHPDGTVVNDPSLVSLINAAECC